MDNKAAKFALIADIDTSFRNKISSMLRTNGYTVDQAKEGMQVFHMMENQKYQFVILGDRVQDMPSEEVISLMQTEEVPIVVMQSKRNADVAKALIDLGARKVVSKSVTNQDILLMLEEIS